MLLLTLPAAARQFLQQGLGVEEVRPVIVTGQNDAKHARATWAADLLAKVYEEEPIFLTHSTAHSAEGDFLLLWQSGCSPPADRDQKSRHRPAPPAGCSRTMKWSKTWWSYSTKLTTESGTIEISVWEHLGHAIVWVSAWASVRDKILLSKKEKKPPSELQFFNALEDLKPDGYGCHAGVGQRYDATFCSLAPMELSETTLLNQIIEEASKLELVGG